jgi:RES domain-containing protein
MVYPPQLLDRLQAVGGSPWSGRAFRHMFADYPPDAENTRGARWNPAEVAAIYTSLTRDGVLAEAEHQIALQPIPPRVQRTVYEIEIALANVLDLTDPQALDSIDLTVDDIAGDDMNACQQIGAAAAWLEHDGILVPSARSGATNLVILAANRQRDARFDVLASEPLGI